MEDSAGGPDALRSKYVILQDILSQQKEVIE